MDASVIVAIVTGVGTLIGVIITSLASNSKIDAKLDRQQAVFEAHVTEQLEQLRKQVEKHNQVIERTYKLEARVKILEGAKNT